MEAFKDDPTKLVADVDCRRRRGGTHWFSSTGINDDDFKFAKAVKKAAAKASATDEL